MPAFVESFCIVSPSFIEPKFVNRHHHHTIHARVNAERESGIGEETVLLSIDHLLCLQSKVFNSLFAVTL